MTSDLLVPPYPFFGSKRAVADRMWQALGNPGNLVIPFLGSASELLARPQPGKVETVNDINGFIANFWRAIAQAPEEVAVAADWPVNETELHARHAWLLKQLPLLMPQLEADPFYFDPLIAGWWAWGASAWIGSGWCLSGHRMSRAKPRPNMSHGQGLDAGPGGPTHRKRPDLQGEGVSRPGPKGGSGVHKGLPDDGDFELDEARPGRKLPRLSGYDGRPNAGTGIHKRMPHLSPNNQGLVGSGQGVHKVSLDPDPPRKLPHVAGPAGTGVGYGAGVNVRDRRDKLILWFEALSVRLRHVRVCCGDFMRVLTDAVTIAHGQTGVILDPPYSSNAGRTMGLYAGDDVAEPNDGFEDTAERARKWAIENGDNPLFRILYCGYEDGFAWPAGWTEFAWSAQGGYGNQAHGRGRANRHRERIWISPHCDQIQAQESLFGRL